MPDRSSAPPAGESRPYALPEVTELTLDNGLRVVLVDREGFPTLAARLTVRAGYDASSDNVAVSELTARLLRDGTERWADSEALAAFIAAHGIDFSASAGTNRVVLSADALSSEAGSILELLASLVGDPTFPEDRVAARVAELIGEIQLQTAQPSFHRERLMARVVFGEHPYSRNTPTVAEVEAVGRDAVVAFHGANYAPTRARLVLVGDLPDGIQAGLVASLGAWTSPAQPYTALEAPALSTCNTAHVVLRPDSAQTSILWVGPGVPLDSAEHFNALVANQVVGGGASARLFMNLREDKSYTYGAYSRQSDYLGASLIRVFSDVRSDVTGPALAEFLLEFARVANEPFGDDELASAISYLSGVFPIQLERNSSLASRMTSLLDLGLDVAYLERYRDAVTAVDGDAAIAAGRTLLARDAMTLVMVGEPDVVEIAAKAVSSTVYVYDLEGTLLRQVAGDIESSCAP